MTEPLNETELTALVDRIQATHTAMSVLMKKQRKDIEALSLDALRRETLALVKADLDK